jgi:hypothetical protein
MICRLAITTITIGAIVTASALGRIVQTKDDRQSTNPNGMTTQRAFLRTLVAARKPGGFIRMIKCSGEEPPLPEEPTILPLNSALDALTRMDQRYKWIDRGVVNLIPITGEPDLLKVRIARYKTNADLDEALRQLLALPQVQQTAHRLGLTRNSMTLLVGPSPFSGGPSRVDVDIRDTTLREALNAIVKAHGRAVWEYRESRCDGRNEFSVGFLAR